MDRTATIVLVSLVFASSAFLLPPAQGQVGDTYTISGDVCIAPRWESECYDPVPGASVRIQGGGLAGVGETDETLTADDNGWFSKSGLLSGDYTLTISHDGFTTQTQSVTLDQDRHVQASMDGEKVSVSGSLVDVDGKGVPGAYIRVYGDDYYGAETAQDGSFQVDVVAGWYDFDIEAPGHGFGGQRMLLDGSDIELTLGALPGQEATIKGRITDQDGAPVPEADVVIDQWEARTSDGEYQYGNFRNWTQTDADGRYEVHVYGGGVSIEFRKQGYAQAYEWLDMQATGTKTLDMEMLRYPEKTAHISGQVTDEAGKPLKHVSVSIQVPEYGIYECSTQARYQTGGGHGEAMPASEPAYYDEGAYYGDRFYEPYYEECAITIHEDGTFTGNVTPGYSIISIWYDHWASCDETYDADGSYSRDCGPDYFQMVETVTLAENADSTLDIALRQRPGPDAAISGYVVDGETQDALSDVWISFSNQENYAYGSAETDSDGSYKVRLRSGYHEVSVYAEGFLPWRGMVYVSPGGETPFDVVLTPGEANGYYGGCCYAYAEEVAVDYAAGAPSSGGADGSMAEPMPMEASDGGSGSDDAYEDLGGGLGPYDPAQRAKVLAEGAQVDDDAIPNPLGFALVGLALAVFIARRR